jgi:hypothetical protein
LNQTLKIQGIYKPYLNKAIDQEFYNQINNQNQPKHANKSIFILFCLAREKPPSRYLLDIPEVQKAKSKELH